MNQHFLKNRPEAFSIVLLLVSIILAVFILFKVTDFFVAPSKAKNLIEKTLAQAQPDAKSVKKHLAEYKEIAQELKNKNLFAPSPPPQHPVKEVWGILGNEVLVKDNWFKVGDRIQDAKIIAIEATEVKIEWNGQVKTFAPINAVGSPSPEKPTPPRPAIRGITSEANIPRGQPTVEPPRGSMPAPERMPEFGFPPPEERARFRQRFESMSEQERQEFRERMRERFGERRQRQVE